MTLHKEIAILGAGPSGLVTARHALAAGLKPIILEKASNIGGVWNPDTGSVWKTMKTNLSKFSCSFEGMPWEASTSVFPTAAEVYAYLDKYASSFGIMPHVSFNSQVTSVTPNHSGGYDVSWSHAEAITTKSVDYVVVATGIFAESYTPYIEGLANFPGEVIHTKEYKDGSKLTDKKVLVIGGSLSAVEVAGDIGKYTNVTHSFRDNFWILKRYIPKKLEEVSVKYPLDLVFYDRKFYASPSVSREEGYKNLNGYMSVLCKEQQEDPRLKIEETNYGLPTKIVISDRYLANTKLGTIKPLKAVATRFEGSKAIFSNGEEDNYDLVVMGTGYRVNLGYLDPMILEQINYNPEDQLQPTILYHATFHPKVPNMAFVGVYKGPYFAVMEQQAKLVIAMATGNFHMPSDDQIREELAAEQGIRNLNPRPQFPHSDYVNFADKIAVLGGSDLVNRTQLERENPALHKQFLENTVLPGNFTLSDIEGQIITNTEILDSCALSGDSDSFDY